MGVIDKLRGTGDRSNPAPKTILAAAVPMSGPGVRMFNRARATATTDSWQNEARYYYDVIGELRAPIVWIANAVSQADLHATDIDPDTGKPTGPSEDQNAQTVATQAFGGVNQRAGMLRTIAICWQCVGEVWVIIRPGARAGEPDRWLALSGDKVRSKGDSWQYTDPVTAAAITLTAQDRMIRIWSPHPFDQSKADSAVRPALPILREIEKASQNIAARLDSRIAMNGLMAIAEELDFPKGDFQTSNEAFMDQLLTNAEYGLQNPGQASSQVPMGFTAPGELIANGGAFAHYDISTQFDSQVVELRQDGRTRLAASLDMPKDVAEGTQGESNHWTSWKVEEDTYKIYIEPLLKAIGDAITENWMQPALIAMGETPETAKLREIGWDTTAIVARPDASETLESLYDKVLISDEYMLSEHGVPEDAMPSPEERTRRVLEKLVGIAPTLLADPAIAQALDLGLEVAPAAAGVDANVTQGGELEAPAPAPEPARALPSTRGEEPAPAPVPDGLVASAELIVYDALRRAGGRLLTNQNRGQFKSTPRHELHTVVDGPHPDFLMEGSFEFADRVAAAFEVDARRFEDSVRAYVGMLLTQRAAHQREHLAFFLRKLT